MSGANRASGAEIVIVGGGIAGAATAYWLGEHEGFTVTVLDRESQLGSHSTSKNASILRTYSEEPAVTELMLETAAFIEAPPPGFTEVPLVDPVGLVMIPIGFDPDAFAAWRERKRPGTVVELEEPELAELAPHFVGNRTGAILVRDEGNLDSSAIFDGFVRGARRRGVTFETDARVTGFRIEDGRVGGVELADGRVLRADWTVIAAGGWAEHLGRLAGSRLRFEARRRHLLVTGHEPRVDPRWPVVWSERDSFYVKPESGGLMVCSCDQDVIDPDRCEVLPEVLERIAERAAACLDGFEDATAAHFWAGMRTFAADDEFAIGPDPDVPGLFWVSGLAGHGICASSGVGRLAAGLLAGAPVDEEIAAAMSPAREGAARNR